MATKGTRLKDEKAISGVAAGWLLPRFRFVIWGLIVLSVVGVIHFASKNAGSYMTYDAGSIVQPKSYVDTWYTSRYGDVSGMTDSELNGHLFMMRMANMPGLLLCAGATLGLMVLFVSAGEGYLKNAGLAGRVLQVSEPSRLFFVGEYEREHGVGSATSLEQDGLIGLGNYVVEYMGQPGADGGIPGTPVDALSVEDARRRLKDFDGRAYLLLNGLKLDAGDHIVPLFSGLPVVLPQPQGAYRDEPVRDAAASSGPVPVVQGDGAVRLEACGDAPEAQGIPTPAASDGSVRPFCGQCGSRLPDHAKFCPRCGCKRDVDEV